MYLEVEWIQVDNVSVVFYKVKEGEFDVLVVIQLNLCYMIDYYYFNEFYYFFIFGVLNVLFLFVFFCGELEFKDIINKVLNVIFLSEVLCLMEKWIKMFNVIIDIWDLYSE